jgi:hypothetical protein
VSESSPSTRCPCSVTPSRTAYLPNLTNLPKPGTASCHVEHIRNLITIVKQRWARLVLGCISTQMTRVPSAGRRCRHLVAWEGVGEDTEWSYTACLLIISQNASRKNPSQPNNENVVESGFVSTLSGAGLYPPICDNTK